MKKITFLLLHLNYGGLEKQTITLINELARTGKYDIKILSVYDLLDGKIYKQNADRTYTEDIDFLSEKNSIEH